MNQVSLDSVYPTNQRQGASRRLMQQRLRPPLHGDSFRTFAKQTSRSHEVGGSDAQAAGDDNFRSKRFSGNSQRLTSIGCTLFLVLITGLGSLHAASPEQSASPIAKWDFQQPLTEKKSGRAYLHTRGPRAPLYPNFPASNHALSLTAPSYLRVENEIDFRFDLGDAITAEAWVNVNSIGDHAYIIGKGRTQKGKDNQNWAFRLANKDGEACVNFLFRSRTHKTRKADWHRWTSDNGFAIGGGWHHVAVSYRFGEPESIQGYVDGKAVTGTWDMGGATDQPPVVDDGQVWIGSSMMGNKGVSFDGRIDNLVVYRGVVDSSEFATRYRFEPQAIEPTFVSDKVVTQLFGPVASYGVIPEWVEGPELEWTQDQLVITRLPHKYDSWGVRDDWVSASRPSMFVRQWTKIDLDAGRYQLLVRSRGVSKLTIDGKPIITTPKQRNRKGAHHVVDPLPEVPVVGMRPAFMNDHERIVDFETDGGIHKVLFEAIVGGPSYRLEVGETCVAIAQQGDMFQVLAPKRSYPLTDGGWNAIASQQIKLLDNLDTRRRRTASSQQDDFWNTRHRYARENLVATKTNRRSIDDVIQAKIGDLNQRISKTTSPASQSQHDYQKSVLPILQAHCARCHGEKEQGELTVLSRERLLAGGESGEPAIVPGSPDKSYLFQLISADADDYRMPPKGDGLSKDEIAIIKRWIKDGAKMPASQTTEIELTPTIDDVTFLRRIYLDTVGVSPSLEEINTFFSSAKSKRRDQTIEALLNDPRWADNWMGYWQDALAENPNLLKPMLNNTGPFRFWIHEALRDNKPMDRFATELILMRGSKWYGGAAGFSVASQNDVPMAAKAHVIGTAFMGIELKCARCHDAPYHSWKQSDLFQMAAMLDRKTLTLPKSSTVPAAFFEKQERKPLIDVTLKPGSKVHADWPFAELSSELESDLLQDTGDTREVLATQVTASRRFAEVMANRMWARLMGAGIVDPVDDWEGNPASNPELLSLLADILIDSGYDQKALAKTIFESQAYQSQIISDDKHRLFPGPHRRRMTAEQVVDTALHATGMAMNTEQLTLDVEGTLSADKFMNFGFPTRSWEFSTLANERDRPSLALPKAQAITDVLKAFGWRNSRPEPTSYREIDPNLIQPGVLANGTLGVWLTTLTDESKITNLAQTASSADEFVENLFLQILTRPPTDKEKDRFAGQLAPGFENRISNKLNLQSPTPRHKYVSWSNHLNSEANVIKVQMQEEVRRGPAPTRMLDPQWRQRAEDAVWALINSPEMILIP